MQLRSGSNGKPWGGLGPLPRRLGHNTQLSQEVQLVEVLVEFHSLTVVETHDETVGELGRLVGGRNVLPARACQRARVGTGKLQLDATPVPLADAVLDLNLGVGKCPEYPLDEMDACFSTSRDPRQSGNPHHKIIREESAVGLPVPCRYRPTSLLGEPIDVRGRVDPIRRGRQLDGDVLFALAVKGGSVREMWVFHSNQDQVDEFWST